MFIHKSISAGKLAHREAVRDHSPGLLGLGFCHKEFALKGRPNAMVFRHGSQGIHFHPFPSVAPSGADFNGAFPGLKAWAVLLNRFAVRRSSGKRS
jgi:hypothetical protein